MLAVHPLRGQPTVLASGVGLRGRTLECAHLATLKDLKAGQKLRIKITGPDVKPLTLTIRTLEKLEAGLYEDVVLEVLNDD